MARFPPGIKPPGSGRKVGSINKRTRSIQETAERLGVDPFEILLLYAKGDWKALGYDAEKYLTGSNEQGDAFFKWTIDPNTRAKCAAEAVQYVFPKLKSVEHTRQNMLEGMSPEQKLEAMKQAVAMLESQVKKSD